MIPEYFEFAFVKVIGVEQPFFLALTLHNESIRAEDGDVELRPQHLVVDDKHRIG